jgi:hypothetical protein
MHINAHFIYLFMKSACVWILSVICSSQYCSGPVDFLMLRVGLL